MKPLSASFFNRPTVRVAYELIGCVLARKQNSKVERFMITETEAYDGPKDLACHSAKGRTIRTEVMFGPAGRWYVYFVYGMHWMLNIVTGPKDYAAAVLIRGIEGMNGPGRITKKLTVTGALHGKRASKVSGLWIEAPREKIPAHRIKKGSRIGVDYAGPIWSKKHYRFFIDLK